MQHCKNPKCKKGITSDEWAANWGFCEKCRVELTLGSQEDQIVAQARAKSAKAQRSKRH